MDVLRPFFTEYVFMENVFFTIVYNNYYSCEHVKRACAPDLTSDTPQILYEMDKVVRMLKVCVYKYSVFHSSNNSYISK